MFWHSYTSQYARISDFSGPFEPQGPVWVIPNFKSRISELVWLLRAKWRIPKPRNFTKSKFHVLIRTNLGISKRAGTARVDLGGARPPIAGFCADLTIPGEIVNFVNFHTSETPKIRLFQFSSILSRHGPCGIATELSKACKIHIIGLSVYDLTQLHGSGRPIR